MEPLDVRAIMDIIPHRYPFLLVDRVLELEEGKRIVALPDKTLLLVIGPDTTVAGQTWRNVRTTRDPPQTQD